MTYVRPDTADTALFRSRWLLDTRELPRPESSMQPRLASRFATAREPESPLDIIGQYAAFIVVHHIDRAVAAACLPEHFELEPPAGTPSGTHPVMYAFGSHYSVRPRFFPLWDYDYAEALVGIPNVMLRHSDDGRSGPRFFMTSVRLNNRFANDIGVALGFPKEMAHFDITDTTYQFSMSPGGPAVMAGAMHVSGDVFDDTFPNFVAVAPLMQQPVISKTPFGLFLATPFHIDTRNAFMRPMTSSFEVHDHSLPGLPKGKYEFKGIDTTAFDGGYLSLHNWQMSPPRVIER